MKPSFLFVFSLVALPVLTSGCLSDRDGSAAPQVGTIAAEESGEAVRVGREAGEKLLEAFRKNDFGMAKDLPFGDEKNTLTEAQFQQAIEKVFRPNGGIGSYRYLVDLNTPPCKTLLWKVTFTPRPKASADAADKDGTPVAAAPEVPAEGVDMLFGIGIGKINGEYRIVGIRLM